MTLAERLQKVQSEVNEAQSDYDVVVALANFLGWLSNNPLLSEDREAAQLLRDIAFESVGRRKA